MPTSIVTYQNEERQQIYELSEAGVITLVSPGTGTATLNPASQYTAPAGAVTAPGYSFIGDTDTGVYAPAANQVALAAGGSAYVTGKLVSGTGTVAIGIDHVAVNAIGSFAGSRKLRLEDRLGTTIWIPCMTGTGW